MSSYWFMSEVVRGERESEGVGISPILKVVSYSLYRSRNGRAHIRNIT